MENRSFSSIRAKSGTSQKSYLSADINDIFNANIYGKKVEVDNEEFYQMYFQAGIALSLFDIMTGKSYNSEIFDLQYLMEKFQDKLKKLEKEQIDKIETLKFNLGFLEKVREIGNDKNREFLQIQSKHCENINLLAANINFELECETKKYEIKVPYFFCHQFLDYCTLSCNDSAEEIMEYLSSLNIKASKEKQNRDGKITINPYHSEKYFFYCLPKNSTDIFLNLKSQIYGTEIDQKHIKVKKISINIYSCRAPCDSCELMMCLPNNQYIEELRNQITGNLEPNYEFVHPEISINFRFSKKITNVLKRHSFTDPRPSYLGIDFREISLNNEKVLDFFSSKKLKVIGRSLISSWPSDNEFSEVRKIYRNLLKTIQWKLKELSSYKLEFH